MPGFREFNFRQDLLAAQTVFSSGVALVHVPGFGVAEMLRTTRWELEQFVKGRGAIGDYLYEMYLSFVRDVPGRSKVIWDLAPAVQVPEWHEPGQASPMLGDDLFMRTIPTGIL